MKKTLKYTIWILGFVFLLAWRSNFAEASGERVNFGSEGYEWELDTTSPIGIYMSSDQLVTHAEAYVSYDPEMLEYVSGGEFVQPGTVRLAMGSDALQTESAMLHFVPRVAGNTQISIQNGNIQNNIGENVTLENIVAPISIPIPEGCRLSGIQVDGDEIPDFNAWVTSYSMEVEYDKAVAQVTAVADNMDSQIDIPETNLNVGNNITSIYVTNINGQRAKYVLNIIRKAAPDNASALSKSEEKTKPVVINKADSSVAKRNRMILFVISVLLCLLLVGIIIVRISFIRKRKRRRRNKKRRSIKGDKSYKIQKMNAEEREYELEETEDFADLEDFHLNDEREVEISVQHVTMKFKREKDEASSIKEYLIRTIKRQRSYDMFHALNDVSFDVKKGDVVGIIGTNGSGKSTLLKIISGVLKPTSGKVEVDKNKIQLLTLGTGFDFELTGKENVYLNGAVIGYSKEFIDEKYDEIVKFAELEGFMDEKVRNYSSGMVSRLGFAIATARETPEILILDEVLSVGDMFFRKKSTDRIKEMMKSGSTVLIVSHSTSVIRENCTKAVWIEKGVLQAIGNPIDVCRAYERMNG